MTGAIRLWTTFLWPHARAALRQICLNDRHRDARRVLKWIQARKRAEVSVKDVRRHALSQSLDADKTAALLESLVTAGWLRRATTKTAGRPVHRWTVNPALLRMSARTAEIDLPAVPAIHAAAESAASTEHQAPVGNPISEHDNG